MSQEQVDLGKMTQDVNLAFVPSMEQLDEWSQEGGCETIHCGCWVEPDGMCEHGNPSWLYHLGMI